MPSLGEIILPSLAFQKVCWSCQHLQQCFMWSCSVVFDAFPCMVPRALWGSFQDDEVGATRFDPGLSVAAEHITRMEVSDAIRVLRSTQRFVESEFGLVNVIYGSLTWSMRWHSYLIHLSSLSHGHSIVCKLDHASTSRLGLPFASQHFLKLGAKCRGTSRLLFWKQSLSATQDQVLEWVFGQIKHFTAEGVDTAESFWMLFCEYHIHLIIWKCIRLTWGTRVWMRWDEAWNRDRGFIWTSQVPLARLVRTWRRGQTWVILTCCFAS